MQRAGEEHKREKPNSRSPARSRAKTCFPRNTGLLDPDPRERMSAKEMAQKDVELVNNIQRLTKEDAADLAEAAEVLVVEDEEDKNI